MSRDEIPVLVMWLHRHTFVTNQRKPQKVNVIIIKNNNMNRIHLQVTIYKILRRNGDNANLKWTCLSTLTLKNRSRSAGSLRRLCTRPRKWESDISTPALWTYDNTGLRRCHWSVAGYFWYFSSSLQQQQQNKKSYKNVQFMKEHVRQ